jgi:hypothetical protein
MATPAPVVACAVAYLNEAAGEPAAADSLEWPEG